MYLETISLYVSFFKGLDISTATTFWQAFLENFVMMSLTSTVFQIANSPVTPDVHEVQNPDPYNGLYNIHTW